VNLLKLLISLHQTLLSTQLLRNSINYLDIKLVIFMMVSIPFDFL